MRKSIGRTSLGTPDYVEPIYQGCAVIGAVATSSLVWRPGAGS